MKGLPMRILLLILAAAVSYAAEINVTGAFARATAPSATTGAVFATIDGVPDELTGATTAVAERVELHSVVVLDSGAKRMTPVERIAVPAQLKPGGLHLMLIGLKQPLVETTSIPLTLTFAKSGTVQVEVPVGSIAANEPPVACGGEGCCAPK